LGWAAKAIAPRRGGRKISPQSQVGFPAGDLDNSPAKYVENVTQDGSAPAGLHWADAPQEDFMPLAINETAPDFTADSTEGPLHFYDWAGDNWVLFFSHPEDFTPVCTTELGAVAKLKPEFDKRGVKVLGLSVDPVVNHTKWAEDIRETQGTAPNYPMIGDTDLKVSKLYGMLPADTPGTSEGRTPADNATVRNVFVIGPDKKIKLVLIYPMSTGRNFAEILRAIDSIQLTARHKVATPADWKQGEDIIISGAVSNEEASKLFPGYKTHKPYLRTAAAPK
jgi:alkyl hydroperoxide reductase subunit AhpC